MSDAQSTGRPGTNLGTSNAGNVAPSMDDDGGFEIPRKQRLRAQKREKRTASKDVFDSGSTNTLEAGKRTRELFIFNLDGDTTVDDISGFLSEMEVQVIETECRSRDNSVNKSFRVAIDSTSTDMAS